jgi:hypothetical protein
MLISHVAKTMELAPTLDPNRLSLRFMVPPFLAEKCAERIVDRADYGRVGRSGLSVNRFIGTYRCGIEGAFSYVLDFRGKLVQSTKTQMD